MDQVASPVLFQVLEGKFCIARLPAGASIEGWSSEGGFCAVTRTPEETSIVCEEQSEPPFAEIERNWRCIKVQGPLDFALQGVLLSLLQPLAEAEIGVFVMSTYDTDYIFVKQYHLQTAIAALEAAGHRLTA